MGHSFKEDRAKPQAKESFIATLDKLFDILNCKYKKIKTCSEFEGTCPREAGCKHEIHMFTVSSTCMLDKLQKKINNKVKRA